MIGEQPLAIDLFCGLGGWTEGLLAEGYDVVGFDIERHEYGEPSLSGAARHAGRADAARPQFKDAALIVASPPCQEYQLHGDAVDEGEGDERSTATARAT